MRRLLLVLTLTAFSWALPPSNMVIFEDNRSYTVDAMATMSSNRLFRAQSLSDHAIAGDVTLTFDNAFMVKGLYTTVLAAGYSVGSEFDTYIGYHNTIYDLFYDLGVVKFKFQSASNDNHAEAYERIGYRLDSGLFTLSLYQEIDSSHDELLDTIIRLTKGFTPKYYGSDLRIQNRYVNLLVGYSTLSKFYVQSDFYIDSVFIPKWDLFLTTAYCSSSTQTFFGLAGLEIAFGFHTAF